MSSDDAFERIVSRSDGQRDDIAVCILTAGPGGAAHWSLRIEELEVDAALLRSGGAERFLVACGVGSAHIVRALREAREMVGLAGSAPADGLVRARRDRLSGHRGPAVAEPLWGSPESGTLPADPRPRRRTPCRDPDSSPSRSQRSAWGSSRRRPSRSSRRRAA